MTLPKIFFRLICLFLFSSLLLIPENSFAQKKKKRNKTEVTADISKKSKTKKSIKALTSSSKKIDGLFTIYQDTITGAMKMLI